MLCYAALKQYGLSDNIHRDFNIRNGWELYIIRFTWNFEGTSFPNEKLYHPSTDESIADRL